MPLTPEQRATPQLANAKEWLGGVALPEGPYGEHLYAFRNKMGEGAKWYVVHIEWLPHVMFTSFGEWRDNYAWAMPKWWDPAKQFAIKSTKDGHIGRYTFAAPPAVTKAYIVITADPLTGKEIEWDTTRATQ